MNERWGKYLASRDWALLKRAVKKRAGNKCERCKIADLEQVHHLTYVRAYREHLDDLQGLCAPCHEFISAVRDDDPALKHKEEALPTQPVTTWAYPPPAIYNEKSVWKTFLKHLGELNPRDHAFTERGRLSLQYRPSGIAAKIIFDKWEAVPFGMANKHDAKINILLAMKQTSVGQYLTDIEVHLLTALTQREERG